ncbi:PAS domain S-box protein [Spirosoma sp. BT704]|uniref:histidine kinase n=2 Tax=Spirosoma validum TaxID=2771355 RepID=A0A927GG51_9BACT|nr:PAS domain S-box protein [Spirosoma validum]
MLSELLSNPLSDLLFEQSDEFMGIYDLEKEQFVRVNSAGVRLLGFASEVALLDDPGRLRSLRIPPLTIDHRAALIGQLNRAGRYEETVQIGRVNGPAFWGRLIISTLLGGADGYALVRLIDQRQLHQTERDLDHSVRRYEAVFSYASIGIVVCDQQGRITSANHLANELFGYQTGELISLTIEQLVPTEVSHFHQTLRQFFNQQPPVPEMARNRDLQARRKDGSVFPVEISLSYFQLEEEHYAVAYIIDTSVKKAAQSQLLAQRDAIQRLNGDLEQKVADRTNALLNTLGQLVQAKDELTKALTAEQQLGELKSRFVSIASHEFRTPLTVVQTSATLIEKYLALNQPDNCQTHLDHIRASTRHLNDILEEFLSVGQIEAGKIEAHPVSVDVAKLLGVTVADMQGILKRDQRVEMTLSGSETARPDHVWPGHAWLDPSLFRKIILNLLTNAIKYSGPGSVVSIQGTTTDRLLTLIVQDQGVGIPPDDQPHLFERFFRASNVTNMAGTGLGLHIVGQYVALMGGQISLQSVLDQGTTVTLTLPSHDDHSAD